MGKKKLRGGYELKKKNGPDCPIHVQEMEFAPETGRWTCPVQNCMQAAFPPRLVSGSGEPIMGRGPLELVVVHDENDPDRVFLRSIADNMMVEVTEELDADLNSTGNGWELRLFVADRLDIG